MLNPKTNQRELCYIVTVGNIEPMVGYDSLELATVNGWYCVVGKGSMKVGDLAIYFEIDSKLPEVSPFCDSPTIVKYKYKIKTQKFGRGGIKYLSQGLLMPLSDFPNLENVEEGQFLTKELEVTYYEPEDNARKASNEELIKTKVEKRLECWCKKHRLLSKFKFIVNWKVKIFEKKIRKAQKKKKTDWPAWVVKTDEERCQNCFDSMKQLPYDHWIATEKIDGTSTTFTMKQAPAKKRELIVCSRNVVYNAPEKEDRNYYKDSDGNVYLEMAAKYDMKGVLSKYLDGNADLEWVTIQGETYGGTIQKRNYGKEHNLAIFNVIYKEKGLPPVRLNPYEMAEMLFVLQSPKGATLRTVPILGNFILPETCDDLLADAGGASRIDGGMREGIVLRTPDGMHSFKAVDNEFLLVYHS